MIRRLAALAFLGSATAMPAQTMRVYSVTRGATNEKLFSASIDFGSGGVIIQPSKGLLYSARLRYDADRFVPTQQYDLENARVRLGLTPVGRTGIKVTSRAQLEQTGLFEFSPDVPLSLTANLGASEAVLNLGGMTLRDLTVRSGASKTTVTFAHPTRGSCSSALFSVGATDLDIENLAQSGCRRVQIEGGVGSVLVDFGGAWRTNTDLDIDLAMGKLTLVIPTGTGVRLESERFLSPMESQGLVKNGNVWVSPDWEKATRILRVQLKTTLAGVEVRWR